jgi:hypothetical protein
MQARIRDGAVTIPAIDEKSSRATRTHDGAAMAPGSTPTDMLGHDSVNFCPTPRLAFLHLTRLVGGRSKLREAGNGSSVSETGT